MKSCVRVVLALFAEEIAYTYSFSCVGALCWRAFSVSRECAQINYLWHDSCWNWCVLLFRVTYANETSRWFNSKVETKTIELNFNCRRRDDAKCVAQGCFKSVRESNNVHRLKTRRAKKQQTSIDWNNFYILSLDARHSPIQQQQWHVLFSCVRREALSTSRRYIAMVFVLFSFCWIAKTNTFTRLMRWCADSQHALSIFKSVRPIINHIVQQNQLSFSFAYFRVLLASAASFSFFIIVKMIYSVHSL